MDKLAAFVGLVPSAPSTGTHEPDGKITPRKNRRLRYLMIESAWTAARSDPSMLNAYTHLTKRMKKSDAIIRIARKLLNRIRFVWLNERPYQCFVN